MMKMNKNIVVIGNLGKSIKPDGQTVRTKTVLDSIGKHYKNRFDTVFIDAGGIKIVKLFLNVKLILNASKIVIMPGRRAIMIITALLHFLRVSERVVHVAIGGWLPDLINENSRLSERERRFKAVLVQMDSIRETLQNQGLDNAVWFPNYRNSSRENIDIKNSDNPPNRFVFYSRVIQEKGVFAAVDAIKKLTDDGEDLILDIYGPVEDDNKSELENAIGNYKNIKYCRVLYGDEILTTLSNYDCMLFPTCYRGEGFPGAVLEAMMAGVPVIATDWKYNREIVKDGETGIICGNQSVDNVYNSIKRIRADMELYRHVCKGAYSEAEKYTEKIVTPILFEVLDDIRD